MGIETAAIQLKFRPFFSGSRPAQPSACVPENVAFLAAGRHRLLFQPFQAAILALERALLLTLRLHRVVGHCSDCKFVCGEKCYGPRN